MELYQGMGRYEDAFDLLVVEGKFDQALHVAATHGLYQGQHEIIIVHLIHYVGTQRITSKLRATSKVEDAVPVSKLLRNLYEIERKGTGQIRRAAQDWEELEAGLSDTSNLPDCEALRTDDFHKDVFACIVWILNTTPSDILLCS